MQINIQELKKLFAEFNKEQSKLTEGHFYSKWEDKDSCYMSSEDIFLSATGWFIDWLEARNAV